MKKYLSGRVPLGKALKLVLKKYPTVVARQDKERYWRIFASADMEESIHMGASYEQADAWESAAWCILNDCEYHTFPESARKVVDRIEAIVAGVEMRGGT